MVPAAAATAAAGTPSAWHQQPNTSFLSSNSSLGFSSRRYALPFQYAPVVPSLRRKHAAPVALAFRGSGFDRFAKRVASGEALKDAWSSANQGFEQLLFESRVAAQRLDRRYSISSRVEQFVVSVGYRAREIDQELGIGIRLRGFSTDLARNWPRYSKQLKKNLDTPLGQFGSTVFFVWLLLSGWFFRLLIFGTWVLPVAVPLLLSAFSNNLFIQGTCPACQKQFVGLRGQVVQCANCRNVVWQPKEDFAKGRGGTSKSSSPDIIDIDIEEK